MTINQIEEAVTSIKKKSYDPTKSINILLTAVQNHADLLKIAGAKAYLLINKFQIIKEALVAWNKIPPPKTWELMKQHAQGCQCTIN